MAMNMPSFHIAAAIRLKSLSALYMAKWGRLLGY